MAILQITNDNFASEVLSSDKPVLLDFWAPWCGPCRMIAPVMEEIAGERDDVRIGKVNVDEEQELAAKFGIMSIPMLILFKNGEELSRRVGAQPKASILKMLEQ